MASAAGPLGDAIFTTSMRVWLVTPLFSVSSLFEQLVCLSTAVLWPGPTYIHISLRSHLLASQSLVSDLTPLNFKPVSPRKTCSSTNHCLIGLMVIKKFFQEKRTRVTSSLVIYTMPARLPLRAVHFFCVWSIIPLGWLPNQTQTGVLSQFGLVAETLPVMGWPELHPYPYMYMGPSSRLPGVLDAAGSLGYGTIFHSH